MLCAQIEEAHAIWNVWRRLQVGMPSARKQSTGSLEQEAKVAQGAFAYLESLPTSGWKDTQFAKRICKLKLVKRLYVLAVAELRSWIKVELGSTTLVRGEKGIRMGKVSKIGKVNKIGKEKAKAKAIGKIKGGRKTEIKVEILGGISWLSQAQIVE